MTRLLSIGRELESKIKDSLARIQKAQQANAILSQKVEAIRKQLSAAGMERDSVKEQAFLLQIEFSGLEELSHRIEV